jgi:N-acetylglutamate synthase-like GNAT family acetyltransferase
MPAAEDRRAPEVRIRPADDDDFELIEAGIGKWSDRQVLLPLSNGALRVLLPDFRILSPAFGPPEVLAFGALRRYSRRLAEIRSLVVADVWQHRGLGRRLVAGLLDEGRREGLERVFVLTRTPGIFEKLDFDLVPRQSLPQKVFVDCSTCRRRDSCDELALVKDLR